MAISDIKEFAHLSDADIEQISREFDAIREKIEMDLSEKDAAYIHRVITFQRFCGIIGRILLLRPKVKSCFWLGAITLGLSKIIDNMEMGHNIMHGQWDWMNDPEIHSSNWEWDISSISAYWQHTHNFIHHKYTNIIDVDDDIGYGIIRVTRDQPWRPLHIFNFINNIALSLLFQYAVGAQCLNLVDLADGLGNRKLAAKRLKNILEKAASQFTKDYLLFPGIAGVADLKEIISQRSLRGFTSRNAFQCAMGSLVANLMRNVWAHAVIFCGHFPDGAEKFITVDYLTESQPQWYLRQLLGSANISGSWLMHFLTGNLSHQIEHHLYPDIPSNRYREIAQQVRLICDKYDLPYTTGPLYKQYFQAHRTILKLSLPNRFLWRTTDNAPETSSERKYAHLTASLGDLASSSQGTNWESPSPRPGRMGVNSMLHHLPLASFVKTMHKKTMHKGIKRNRKK